MKTTATKLILVLIICQFYNCAKLDELTTFDIPYNQEATLPPAPKGITVENIIPFNTDSKAKFEENNAKEDQITEIKIKKLSLKIKNPSGEDLSFLKSMTIFISSDESHEMRLAWSDNISDQVGNELVLDVTDSDLKKFFFKDNFNFIIQITTDKDLKKELVVEMESSFSVNFKIFGI